MAKMDSDLVKDYLDAFQSANPGKQIPTVSFRSGWYIVGDKCSVSKWRKTDMKAACDRLKQRSSVLV